MKTIILLLLSVACYSQSPRNLKDAKNATKDLISIETPVLVKIK